MNSPKIIVFAYSDVGHACLDFLLKRKENVACVYTHEDKAGENLWFPSVRKLAESYSIPVRTPENLKAESESNFIKSLSPELIFSFYYRNLIPNFILQLPPLGAFNLHGSYLPKFRGRAPVNWAILSGETKTGATLHVMIDKPDAGDIVDQEAVEIGPDDTAIQVQSRVTQAAVKVLERQIENLKNDRAPRIPQNHAQSSYFGRRRPEDGEIDWGWPAARIHNLVRAVTHPYPGAFGEIFGEKVWVWRTQLNPTPGPSPKGEGNNHFTNDDSLVITCGDGKKLEILSLQRKDEPEISGKEFVKRYIAAGRTVQ